MSAKQLAGHHVVADEAKSGLRHGQKTQRDAEFSGDAEAQESEGFFKLPGLKT